MPLGLPHHGRKRLLHTKFYTFTRPVARRSALFLGSHDLTMNAARHQWNDLYLMDGDEPLFDGPSRSSTT